MKNCVKAYDVRSIAFLPPSKRQEILENLPRKQLCYLAKNWRVRARPEQLAPKGDWRIWLFLGGRGAGKTRAGAEWIAEGVQTGAFRRIGLVGATWHDVRSVMIEGESGLLSVSHATFEPANRRILWDNGAVGDIVSAEEPDAVRGHQFDCVWADEFCKWNDPQASLDMVLMALRLGDDPRMLVTTTPRAIAPMKKLLAMDDVVTTRSATHANAANLAPTFLAGLELRYGGTRLGRQELEAELIEDNDAALWKRAWIERTRLRQAPRLVRIVVAVDPPASVAGDECGIVVAGLGEDGAGYILADRSQASLTAAGWARRVADAFIAYEADTIIAEANQGGDMVKQVLIDVLPYAPVKLVHATRDKCTRAMPAAALYEQGRIHHVGAFAELEDQMVNYDGTGKSPDRMDALVWALTNLFPLQRVNPAVRDLGR